MTAPAQVRLRQVSLEDRWRPDAGDALMSGVQAIVRALLDQRRDDEQAGIRSGGLVSGYPGSPLGGLDRELMRREADLQEAGIVFRPGLNEELAATAVWGSQLAYQLPDSEVDGVLGLWFGKSPGLDRAGDAIRHASFCGVGPCGGAVAVVGDDPACKSSTLPSCAERTLSGLMLPVLAPSSVQDVLDLGRHALRLSRASGLWCAIRLVADVADATASVTHRGHMAAVQRLVEHTPTARLLGPQAVQIERGLTERRLPAAVRYAREHALNRVSVAGDRDEIGLIASGSAYAELLRALRELGLERERLNDMGVRVLKVGMPWPLDHEAIRDFASGLRRVLVVEDKLAFLEEEVKAALYGRPEPPEVLGKRDGDGMPLLSAHGALGADEISRALHRVLDGRLAAGSPARKRIEVLAAPPAPAPLPIARTPFFCSGCPHSTSTRAEPGTLVGAGIGCHVMLVQGPTGQDAAAGTPGHPGHQGAAAEPRRAGEIVGLTQMGGEGSQWIGMAPFVQAGHFTQNIGDGTFHHSGSLALRAAVAAGVNITYKLLCNDAVAMTGGQPVQGSLRIPELTRMLRAEGVARIAITTEDPRRYRRVRLAPGTRVHDRARLPEVERELAAVRGVTVLIHDQMCAAERRRLRRRGKLPEPARRAWINERVCEGCGDCGRASGCLSVEPVQTELGRKTRIHQASCNTDMSCLRGDCPAFLTVTPAAAEQRIREPPTGLPEPPTASQQPASAASGPPAAGGSPSRECTVRMVGIGGTGVLTAAQVLAMAAHLQGAPAAVLDQTGLSQKAGPVVSDVRIGGAADGEAAPRAASACLDVLIGFDLLGTADSRNLLAADPDRTVAVLSATEMPTGEMVTHGEVPFPDRDDLLARIGRRVREMPVVVDARTLSERAFGDDLQANMVLLGAAWQLGVIPVGWAALCRALELNGAAVARNLAAMRWGRALVAAPEAVERLLRGGETAPPTAADPATLAEVRRRSLPRQSVELIAYRAHDLRGFGGRRAMERYLDALERIAAIESERAPGHREITESVARQLHRLTAYKDEYEVARLHLLAEERARRERELGAGARWWLHLHPPTLRAIGLSRKIRLGRWSLPLLHALRAGRRLRGTPLDPFGRTQVRRMERALPGEYLALIEQALAMLQESTHPQIVAISEQAELIRGYEQIKLAGVQRWRAASAALIDRLAQTAGRLAR